MMKYVADYKTWRDFLYKNIYFDCSDILHDLTASHFEYNYLCQWL